ncbi:hypothetical protein V5S96_08085 [Corynebacterium mastitidis]|uniref:Uncharacterized protein n=1 Tax=Corynebacterium mastitidis TaxID=161890 RepID=A0ABU8P232_9CORY
MPHQGDGGLRVLGAHPIDLLGEGGGVGTQVGAREVEGAGVESHPAQRVGQRLVGQGAHALAGEDEHHAVFGGLCGLRRLGGRRAACEAEGGGRGHLGV